MKDTRIVCDNCDKECCVDDHGRAYIYVTFVEKADNMLDLPHRHYCHKCYMKFIEQFKEVHPEADL